LLSLRKTLIFRYCRRSGKPIPEKNILMATVLTLIFIFALGMTLLLRLWLARRQMNHVSAHRHAVPAEFADSMSLSEHQRAADYTLAKQRLSMASSIVDTAVALLLTLGGGLDLLWRTSGQYLSAQVAHGTLFILMVTVLTSLISLPLSLISTFGIESRFGFNKMTWSLYLRDTLRSTAVGTVIGVPLIMLVLWLMKISGPNWWLWVWCVWSGFSLLMVALYPTLIAPLFNRFSPLQDLDLKQRIEALLQRVGFRSQGVFVMDGSTRSSHGNAYFTGFGSAKRIVFFDTLLERLTPAEIEAVLAHELGHFRMKHITRRIALTFTLSLLALFILGLLIREPWFYLGMGVHQQSAALALILFFTAAPAITFPLTPLSSLMSRKHEFEADDFARSETDAADLVNALVKLYRDNASTLTPDPVYSAFYDSHPPASIRIAHLKGEPS
jgi:STE24 endopeptidase